MPENRIDKERLARRFARNRATYRANAVVQSAMAERLTAAIPCVEFQRGLEFGCGAGVLTDLLRARCCIRTFYLNDLSREGIGVKDGESFLAGDIETLDFPERLDLIAANAVWQWLRNPEAMVRKMRGAMNSGGIAAISSFAPGNLVEIAKLTGAALPYRRSEEFRAMFEPGFEIIHFEEEEQILRFASPLEVLGHLKRTGVTGIGSGEVWTRGRLERFSREYSRRYSDGAKVLLTYRPLLLIARLK